MKKDQWMQQRNYGLLYKNDEYFISVCSELLTSIFNVSVTLRFSLDVNSQADLQVF